MVILSQQTTIEQVPLARIRDGWDELVRRVVSERRLTRPGYRPSRARMVRPTPESALSPAGRAPMRCSSGCALVMA